MVGLALIACLASLGEGLRDSERSALAGQVTATHVISSQNGFQTISPEVARVATTTMGATTVSGVRAERALSDGDEVTVNGVAPQTITRVVTLAWAAGDDGTLSGLADGQAVVSERFAEDRALGVGETTTVTTPSGARVTATVAGIFSPSRFDSVLGEVVLTQAAFDRAFPRPADAVVLVAMSGPAAEATVALTASLDGVTSATALTTGDWIDERAAEIDGLLNMLYVLLALSVAIALLGMVNTLALAVMERTRELAMLRAVGASRRQVRRMIRHESVVIALIGAATGLPLGVGLAVLATRAMSEYDVHVSVPVGTPVVVTIAATVGAIWAAAGPARRAGRVQIVSGLADS
jgi:ABC-type lipoprotein release transport system permease subunit